MEDLETLQDAIAFAVAVERRVAELYREFSFKVETHRDFWWSFSLEEESHAALLRSLLTAPPLLNGSEGIIGHTDETDRILQSLGARITEVRNRPVLRSAEVLRIGIDCEDLSVEETFQRFLAASPSTRPRRSSSASTGRTCITPNACRPFSNPCRRRADAHPTGS